MKPLLLPLLLAFGALTAQAERAPRPTVLPADSGSTARVIVKFKPDATTLRTRALSAGGEGTAGVLGARAGALGGRLGLALKAGHAVSDRAQVVSAEGLTGAQLAARLAADADVEYAEEDRRMTRLATPNDPLFLAATGAEGPVVGQWFLRAPAGEATAAINAVGAWDRSQGGPAGSGVIVAVLDTGVRGEHPDLAGKLVAGYDMVSDTAIANDGNGRDSDPSDPGDWVTSAEAATSTFRDCEVADSSWHGTQVAGIVGALTNNASGVAGAGWNARVLPVRVLGKCYGNTSDIAAGIRWAAGLPVQGIATNPNPARVINLSLGGSGSCGATYQQAIDEAVAAGSVVVVAAGNSAGQAVGTPGNCNNVITVGALRHVGTKVGYSDVGSQVALSAPGGNCVNVDDSGPCLYPIVTTLNAGTQAPAASIYSNGTTHPSVGTSFSSPQVAATVAMMLDAAPALTADQVRRMLQSSARAFPTSGVAADETGPITQCRAPSAGVQQLQCYCTTSTCGAGMLDAAAAVALAPSSAVITPVITSPTTTTAGESITLSAAATVEPAGRQVESVVWRIISGGDVATLAAPTNAETVSLNATGSGTVVVQATVTDSLGFTTSSTQTITVASSSSSSSGGGGAVSLAWLLGLAAACAGLRRRIHR